MRLSPRHQCSGCAACCAVCPASAIVMRADHEGFNYPEIDSGKCTNCGYCGQACPILHTNDSHEPLVVYAVKNKDEAVRQQSSSGGMFTLLAQWVMERGGIVYGAGWSTDWCVVHKGVENEHALAEIRGAKYVQSEIGDIFRQVKEQLDSGRKVLFSGCPCQIAGLRSFLVTLGVSLPITNAQLLLVDLICHAVSSPKVFRLYREEIEKKHHAKTKGIFFRHKMYGWKKYSLSFVFANAKAYLSPLNQDFYLRGFLSELYNRPSCSVCSWRNLVSGSDITIADYWRVHKKFPTFDDDKGVSLVMANSLAGLHVLQDILPVCEYVQADFSDVKATNPAVWRLFPPNRKRKKFFNKLGKENIEILIEQMLKPSLYGRLRMLAGCIKQILLGRIK